MPETNTKRIINVLAARGKQHPAPSPIAIAALDPRQPTAPAAQDDGDPHHFNERTLGPRGPHTDN